jgi:hypothetical protein
MATFMKGNKEYIEYIVPPGETAWHIAQTHLGNGSRWNEIVKKNENDGHPPISVFPHVYANQVVGYPDGVIISSNTDSNFRGTIKVIASDGVNIRARPDHKSAVLVEDKYTKGAWYNYKLNSQTSDGARVYVEVNLHNFNGYASGWLPVSGPVDLVHNTGPTEEWVSFVGE